MAPSRHRIWISTLAASLLLSAVCVADVNRIVLRINDRIATLYDYEKLKSERIAALQRAEMPDERRQQLLADVGEATMRDLFEELLILSRADQLDMQASPSEIRAAVERAKQNFGFTTDEDFERALAQSNLTRETFAAQMEKNLRIQRVMGREVSARVQLEEEDLRRYYQGHLEDFRQPLQLKVREVVVLESSGLEAAALSAEAEELRDKLLTAEDAETLIEEYRTRGVTTNWIELGWVEPGDLDPGLAAAVVELSSGELSAPVAARGGLHLLQALDRREADIRDFADVRDEIESSEHGRLFQAELAQYMDELERSSHIVLQPPPEAAAFRGNLAPELGPDPMPVDPLGEAGPSLVELLDPEASATDGAGEESADEPPDAASPPPGR